MFLFPTWYLAVYPSEEMERTVKSDLATKYKSEELEVFFPPTGDTYRVLPWLARLVVKYQNTMKFASDIT